MNKKILFGILILLVFVCVAHRYIYKPHRDISTENAAYKVSITGLQQEFATNDSLALSKYHDETIELTAQVTAIDTENKAIVLDNKVFATFEESLSKDILSGKTLKIKGRFLGDDELLEEFKIDQSSIVR